MKTPTNKRRCAALLAMGAAIASHAWAQPAQDGGPITIRDTAPEFRQFDKVEITGSALRRQAESRALPVHIITRADIRKTGLTQTSQLIQNLPFMSNMVEAGQFLASNGGFANAAIHGMPNGTLVLVNGMRLAPYGRQSIAGGERTGVDLDNIPISAIDRIEVLSDGASSLYGTDALAGVLNIIMSEERKGLSINADKTRPFGGAAQTDSVSLQLAKGSMRRDGFHLRAEFEHSERGALSGSDRPSLSTGGTTIGSGASATPISYTLADLYTSPATLYANNTVWNSAWSPALGQGQGCPTGWISDSNGLSCQGNPYPMLDYYPSQRRTALHVRGELQAEAGQRYFADLLWGTNTQQARTVFDTSARYVDASNTVAAPWLAQAGMTQGAWVLWRPAIAGPVLAFEHSTLRLEAGVAGQAQAWSYQTSTFFSQSEADRSYTRQLPQGLLGDLGSLPVSEGWFSSAAAPGLNAQIESQITSYPLNHGRTSIAGAMTRGQRDLWEMPGGAAQWALGAEIRRETSLYRNANTPLSQPDFDLKRNTAAAYTELRTPWRDNFESTASVRADRYDHFHTVNGKLSALWRPTPDWQLRSALGTGFRAPQTAQFNEQRYYFGNAQIPAGYTCPTDLANSLGAQCGQGDFIPTYTQGATTLQPETSQQFTLGVRHDIHHRLSLSADFWQVDIQNEIGQDIAAGVLLNPQQHADNFIRDSNGDLALYLPLRNNASSFKRGIDFDLTWRHPTDHGRISLQAQLTRYLASWKDAGMGQESDLGRISSLTYKPIPKFNARILLAYNQADWNVGAIWHYRSAYTDIQLPGLPTVTIAAFSTLDLVAQYSPTRALELRAGVYNVANTLPTQGINSPSVQTPGIDTAYSNLWGRTLRIGATYKF